MLVFPGLILLKLLAVFPQEELTVLGAVAGICCSEGGVETGETLAPERYNEVFGGGAFAIHMHILSYSPFPLHSLPRFLSPLVLKLSFQLIPVRLLMEILDNRPAYM